MTSLGGWTELMDGRTLQTWTAGPHRAQALSPCTALGVQIAAQADQVGDFAAHHVESALALKGAVRFSEPPTATRRIDEEPAQALVDRLEPKTLRLGSCHFVNAMTQQHPER
jgi:hypothetical protein